LPALLAAVVLAGCGSSSKEKASSTSTGATSSSTTTATTTTTSASTPVATAEAICTRVNDKIALEHKTVKTLRELAVAASNLALTEQTGLNELTKLEVPAAIAHEWRQILVYRRTLVDNLNKLSVEAQHNEIAKFHIVNASTSTAEHGLLAVGTQAGLKECARAS